MSRYHDTNGDPIYAEDVLDPEELADYRRQIAERARGGSDALVRRARMEATR